MIEVVLGWYNLYGFEVDILDNIVAAGLGFGADARASKWCI